MCLQSFQVNGCSEGAIVNHDIRGHKHILKMQLTLFKKIVFFFFLCILHN